MAVSYQRDWAQFETFDPSEGMVIREPPGEGKGYWAGAPGATYDAASNAFYLVYRLRRPRGVEPDRGGEMRIAKSVDGINFDDIWSGTKAELQSTSIERSALARLPNGNWGLYVSYVDPADGRWRIDLVESADLGQCRLADAQPVLTAAAIQAEGVKDPFLFRLAGLYHMVASYATAECGAKHEDMHGTQDAYNTGLIRSRSGLAISQDGRRWNWEGEILGPSASGWDSYCARIGTLWRHDGAWLALYDGSASVEENYEERCGLAYSLDLRKFHRVTGDAPLMIQPNASGALRYFDVVRTDAGCFIYYETARPDGSHDLRVFKREL